MQKATNRGKQTIPRTCEKEIEDWVACEVKNIVIFEEMQLVYTGSFKEFLEIRRSKRNQNWERIMKKNVKNVQFFATQKLCIFL